MGDAAFLAENLSLTIPAGLLVAWLLLWWGLLRPHLLIWLLAATLIAGQLIRLPLPGQGGGVLPSDIVAFALVVTLSLRAYTKSARPEIITVVSTITLFILWTGYILVLQVGTNITGSEVGVASAYLVRLATYMFLIPCLMQAAAAQPEIRRAVQYSFLSAVVAIGVGGLIQYTLFPNLAALGLNGWDPHEHRLISTWLDPNLVGLLFVIAAPLFIYLYIQTKKYRYAFWGVVVLICLVLTASRSSFIAAVGSSLITLWMSGAAKYSVPTIHTQVARRTSYLTILISFALLIVLFPQRFTGLITSDATVSLRSQALSASIRSVVEPHAIAGVGYNAYQFIAQREGLISSFSIHSRAGTDNSLLTLWATTGAIGLLLSGLIFTFVWHTLRSQSKNYQAPLWVFFASITALIIHSQFINSALYGHILIAVAFLLALTYSSTKTAYDN